MSEIIREILKFCQFVKKKKKKKKKKKRKKTLSQQLPFF